MADSCATPVARAGALLLRVIAGRQGVAGGQISAGLIGAGIGTTIYCVPTASAAAGVVAFFAVRELPGDRSLPA